MKSHVLCLLIAVCLANLADGSTITVRKDGSGNYTAIQPALDAAANGDTILIGPGEYTETTIIRPDGWLFDVEAYGKITSSALVIIGAGADATFIGPTSYEQAAGSDTPQGLISDHLMTDLRISGLTIRNCYTGMTVQGPIQMEQCSLANNRYGVMWTCVGSGGSIRNCYFSATHPGSPFGLETAGTGTGALVEDCEFAGAPLYVTNPDAVVRRCRIVGPTVVAAEIADGARCEFLDCDILGVDIGVRALAGSACEIRDSRISGSMTALRLDRAANAVVEASTLTGGDTAVVYAREPNTLTIHGCDLQRGTGSIIRCLRAGSLGDVTYDATNNFWGTSDIAQIQAWITDSNDDATIHATVLYSPFFGQSVPAEATSWGNLKATFR